MTRAVGGRMGVAGAPSRRCRLAAGLGVVAAVGLMASIEMPAVDAQTGPVRPAVVPGAARADAEAYKFGIGLGGSVVGDGKQLALTRGVQTATANDLRAEATAIALDLGLVPSLDYRYPPDCPPVAPKFAAGTLPRGTFVQSTDPGASTPRPTEVRWPGAEGLGDVAGVQDATAGPDLRSSATTTIGEVVGPFLRGIGVRTQASSSVDPSGRRIARSEVAADAIEVAGLATISQPRFVAVSTSDGTSSTSFTFDFVYFLGQYRTGAEGLRALEDAKALAEGLFAGLGVKVDLPVGGVVATSNPSASETLSIASTLSPLRVRLSKIPLARDLLGPLLASLAPQIEELKQQIRVERCADKSLLNVIGIAVDMLSGEGELGTSIGKVSASTSDAWTPPFVPRAPTTTAPRAPDVTTTTAAVAGITTVPRRRSTGAAPTTVPPVSTAPTTSAPVQTTTTTTTIESPTTTVVQRVSSPPPSGTRGGLLAWVSVALLGGVGCAAFADRFALVRQRIT